MTSNRKRGEDVGKVYWEAKLCQNKRCGVLSKNSCVIQVFSASMWACVRVCVCVYCVYVSVYEVSGGQRTKYSKQKWTGKKTIKCYFIRDALVHLDEKPLFHNYAIFPFFLPLAFASDSPQISNCLLYPSQISFPLSKNHNIRPLVQGEHATAILFLNLRANNSNTNKKFPLLSFEMIRCKPVWFCWELWLCTLCFGYTFTACFHLPLGLIYFLYRFYFVWCMFWGCVD